MFYSQVKWVGRLELQHAVENFSSHKTATGRRIVKHRRHGVPRRHDDPARHRASSWDFQLGESGCTHHVRRQLVRGCGGCAAADDGTSARLPRGVHRVRGGEQSAGASSRINESADVLLMSSVGPRGSGGFRGFRGDGGGAVRVVRGGGWGWGVPFGLAALSAPYYYNPYVYNPYYYPAPYSAAYPAYVVAHPPLPVAPVPAAKVGAPKMRL